MHARWRGHRYRGSHWVGLRLVQETGHLGFLVVIWHHLARMVAAPFMRRAAASARSAALVLAPRRASKNRGPDLAHGSWLVLGGPAAMAQLEGGADLPPSAPLIGVAGRSIRALHRSLIACYTFLDERFGHAAPHVGEARSGPPREDTTGLPAMSSRCCRRSGWRVPQLNPVVAVCRALLTRVVY